MSHVKIPLSLLDLKDFILSIHQDLVLSTLSLKNNNTISWMMHYINKINLSDIQKNDLKAIFFDLNKYYNYEYKKPKNILENNLLVFLQHVFHIYKNYSIDIQLFVKLEPIVEEEKSEIEKKEEIKTEVKRRKSLDEAKEINENIAKIQINSQLPIVKAPVKKYVKKSK